jgi:hypothetical protein
MSDFQPRPNAGSLGNNYQKKSEAHPDFKGSVFIEKDYLIDLIKNRTDVLVEIKLSGWKKQDKNGKPFVSVQVDTFVPKERQDAAPTEEKDPWL